MEKLNPVIPIFSYAELKLAEEAQKKAEEEADKKAETDKEKDPVKGDAAGNKETNKKEADKVPAEGVNTGVEVEIGNYVVLLGLSGAVMAWTMKRKKEEKA